MDHVWLQALPFLVLPDTVSLGFVEKIIGVIATASGSTYGAYRVGVRPIFRRWHGFMGRLNGAMGSVEIMRTELGVVGDRLSISAAYQRVLANQAAPAMLECDSGGGAHWANDAFEQMTGLSKEDASGRGWLSAFADVDRRHVTREMDQAILEERHWRTPATVAAPSGILWPVTVEGWPAGNGHPNAWLIEITRTDSINGEHPV